MNVIASIILSVLDWIDSDYVTVIQFCESRSVNVEYGFVCYRWYYVQITTVMSWYMNMEKVNVIR